jgi:hypothetical protein
LIFSKKLRTEVIDQELVLWFYFENHCYECEELPW